MRIHGFQKSDNTSNMGGGHGGSRLSVERCSAIVKQLTGRPTRFSVCSYYIHTRGSNIGLKGN